MKEQQQVNQLPQTQTDQYTQREKPLPEKCVQTRNQSLIRKPVVLRLFRRCNQSENLSRN